MGAGIITAGIRVHLVEVLDIMEACPNCRSGTDSEIGDSWCPLHFLGLGRQSTGQNLQTDLNQDMLRCIRVKETSVIDSSSSSIDSRLQNQSAVLSTPIREEDQICSKCRRPGQFLQPLDIQIYCGNCLPCLKCTAWDLSHCDAERLCRLIKSAVFESFRPEARLHTLSEYQDPKKYEEKRSIGELLQIARNLLFAKAGNPGKSPCFQCLAFKDEQGRCLCAGISPKKPFKLQLKSSVLIGGRIFDVDFQEKRVLKTDDSGTVFEVRETVVLKCSHPVTLCEVWIGTIGQDYTILEGQIDGTGGRLIGGNIAFSLNPQIPLREESEIGLIITAKIRASPSAEEVNPNLGNPCIGEDGSIWYSWTNMNYPGYYRILSVCRAKYKLN